MTAEEPWWRISIKQLPKSLSSISTCFNTWICSQIFVNMPSADWNALVDAKRAHLYAQIRPEWRLPGHITKQVRQTSDVSAFDLLDNTNLLSQREREITEKYDASTLIEMIAIGAISSVEVTTAFCKRAAAAQQLVCISLVMIRCCAGVLMLP